MAIDPIHSLASTGAPPSRVAHLGLVPDEPATERIEELSRGLETERSAGRALLAAVVELERRLNAERAGGRALLAAVVELESRLNAERAGGQALRATVRELKGELEDERAERRRSREANAQLWSQVIDLNGALELAERPWWRRLRHNG